MTNDAQAAVAGIIEAAEAEAEVSEPPIELKEADLTQRDALLQVCDRAQIWRSIEGETFATVPVNDHVEHHAIGSRGFRDWMVCEVAQRYLNKGRPASVNESAIRDARMGLEARWHRNRMSIDAALRVSQHDDAIYVDLGTSDWAAVEATGAGWHIVPRAPVPIIRSRRTGAFPLPQADGSFGPLRRVLAHLPDDDFIMFLAWCLSALLPAGPYPILILSGEQGSGKSTLARLAQRLTDPVNGDLLQPPGDDRDLIAAARNNRTLAFDNFSGLRADLADSLCRLATGSEIGGRALYSNHETASFSACRPLVLNGIPDLAARGDLADRSIILKLDALADRITERDWAMSLATILPSALGALFNALVVGLARLDATPTPDVRMADFARFVVAAEAALPWERGAFLLAYRHNRQQGLAGLAEGDLVAKAMRAFAEKNPHGWTGLMSDLHERLSAGQPFDVTRTTDWPKNARWFSDRLRRAAPSLRAQGIDVTERRDSHGMNVSIRNLASLATPATPTPAANPQVDGASVASAASHPMSEASIPRVAQGSTNMVRDGWSVDDQVDFVERAAIAEFDGGLSRDEAEALAAAAVGSKADG